MKRAKRSRIRLRVPSEKERCPMRIAELAVPTKRHCLDTWRHKSYLLPGYMVDRLKQHVLDQRPIVEIPEAIRCFQNQKRQPAKRSKKTINKLSLNTPKQYADNKTLCVIFANKVLRKLSKPLNLLLNDDLQKLARVVADDVDRITNFRKYSRKEKEKLYKCRSIRNHVIKKITVWILDILQDYEYKKLEQDLRDLEEEEGPVLDFLDDVVNCVLVSFQIPTVFITSMCNLEI
ncbi:uncharacterized protein LOC142975830 [Anticarsia gemmatalis]|uniref:uncharacterized protein LOC142975830 n=1 Tax=Anticarsia gemmatalis TaxID=129554 RepID=UPI003F76DA83